MTKSRGRVANANNTGKFQQLITAAIDGRDDEMAQRARQVAAGKIDARTMTFREVFAFVEPGELYDESHEDWLRRVVGSVTYDEAYAVERRQFSQWRHERSQALLQALMMAAGADLLDLWLSEPWALNKVLDGGGQADAPR